MAEKRKNKSYSKEFKEEAVALTERGYSVAEATKAVGIRTKSTVSLETRTGGVKIGQSAQSLRYPHKFSSPASSQNSGLTMLVPIPFQCL